MEKAPKKLIEVALPLDAINEAAKKEKSIRHGHPSTLHLWWARRPLAAARAVLFAQLVNDPGGERGWGKFSGQTKEDAQIERERLFSIIRNLIDWKNVNNDSVFIEAQNEIRKSWEETCSMNQNAPLFQPEKIPGFHDPFSGGGALPFEAQKLGLEAYASDLNPVAVMISKAIIELPQKFAGQKPISLVDYENQDTEDLFGEKVEWRGSKGLAEDIRYYGNLLEDKAFKELGQFYPKLELDKTVIENRKDLKGLIGQKLEIIAWIWVRTIRSPNPAYSNFNSPLCSTFVLSSKKGKEAWLKPRIEGDKCRFDVCLGPFKPELKTGTKLGRGAKFRCIVSNTPINADYIRSEAKEQGLGQQLIAVVAKAPRGRIYLSATEEMENLAASAKPKWRPRTPMAKNPRWFSPPGYGLPTYGDIFTDRQLLTLNTISELIPEIRDIAIRDAIKAGMEDNKIGLSDNGNGATAYGDSIAVYLTFSLDRMAMTGNSLVRWNNVGQKAQHCFGRQAIPMLWDFAETNFFGTATGSIEAAIKYSSESLDFILPGKFKGTVMQHSAFNQKLSQDRIVSTDPPYYDNVGYADLSDFFYVWMRKVLRPLFPELFSVMMTPKDEELVAIPYRRGGKNNAEAYFLNGMERSISNLYGQVHPGFPVTLYYAFKQDKNAASAGWETFLEAVIRAGFRITGTWPMRTEMQTRQVAMGTNALASSIILVCRKRENSAETISRRDFQRELKATMPEALDTMLGGKGVTSPIAPVDLAQAAIGPGMAVFSKYAKVLEADGTPMSVHDALVQINHEIDDYFNAAEGDLDPDSRFCIDWFQQYGFKTGPFGEADVVARAKGTSVDAVANAGVIASGGGKVRLFTFADYPKGWNPDKDPKVPVWEATHQLIRALREGGEKESGFLLSRLPGKTDQIRQLAYRLYTLCDRKGWAEEARAYNELISSWHGIVSDSEDVGIKRAQMSLFKT